MFKISFRNRIALYYSTTTATLVLAVFVLIFLIVRHDVYQSLDDDLQKEIDDLYTEITITPDGFAVEQEEWHEKEHNTLDINPIFIQFTDYFGRITDRSPNLKRSSLGYRSGAGFFNSRLDSSYVRQAQAPVRFGNETVGYIIVAVPVEDADAVLGNLRNVLLITYPLLLFVLFAVARLIAGSSIRPVRGIIDTAGKISRENLAERIPYPHNRDELYTLSMTINSLLDRIESAVLREKQFTSDASHELRTPVAVIKGTLEVLIRKPRSTAEYEARIAYCIAEMDRINIVVDQLLLLARFESLKQATGIEDVNIRATVLDCLARHSALVKAKGLSVDCLIGEDIYARTDNYLLSIVLDNIVSNAIKYSKVSGTIKLSCISGDGHYELEISDDGIGIAKEDLNRVFDPFYRSRPEEHPGAKGSGLGLSIAGRICAMLGIAIRLASHPGRGTSVSLAIPKSG